MTALIFFLGALFGVACTAGWKLGAGLFLRFDFWLRKKRGKNCAFDKDCRNDASYDAISVALDADEKVIGDKSFRICQEHMKMLTIQAIKMQGTTGKVEGITKDGKPLTATWAKMPGDSPKKTRPDMVFTEQPDMSILKPEPLDPLTAAIEAAYKNKKGTS